MKDLSIESKECFNRQVDPDKSEFECFFHYDDEKLFSAGFTKGYEFAQSKKKENRYFRVSYTANSPKGNATGAVMYKTNGTYLGLNEVKSNIKESNGLTNVAILSIEELNEEDYNYYITN